MAHYVDGRFKLVSCGSKSLTPTQQRYATNELECLAVYFAIDKCSYYRCGSPEHMANNCSVANACSIQFEGDHDWKTLANETGWPQCCYLIFILRSQSFYISVLQSYSPVTRFALKKKTRLASRSLMYGQFKGTFLYKISEYFKKGKVLKISVFVINQWNYYILKKRPKSFRQARLSKALSGRILLRLLGSKGKSWKNGSLKIVKIKKNCNNF